MQTESTKNGEGDAKNIAKGGVYVQAKKPSLLLQGKTNCEDHTAKHRGKDDWKKPNKSIFFRRIE